MKLYYSPGACSLAPHMALCESKIPFTPEKVDLKAKTYSGGDFKKVNPNGAVPVLELDNGERLTEAAVILQYVADQAPSANLIPAAGTWQRYKAQQWLNFVATEMHKGFSPLWKPNTPEAYKEIALQNLKAKFDFLSAHFEKSRFLMGDDLTVADFYLTTILGWSKPLKVDLTPWPKLTEFAERVRARPGVQQAMREEGLIQ